METSIISRFNPHDTNYPLGRLVQQSVLNWRQTAPSYLTAEESEVAQEITDLLLKGSEGESIPYRNVAIVTRTPGGDSVSRLSLEREE